MYIFSLGILVLQFIPSVLTSTESMLLTTGTAVSCSLASSIQFDISCSDITGLTPSQIRIISVSAASLATSTTPL